MKQDKIKELIELAEESFKCKVNIGDSEELRLNRVSTGIPPLDKILKGGFKRGGFHLIVGQFATGKTFMAQKAIEFIQKQDGIAVLIDAERRYDPDWFKLTGVDISKLIVFRPNTGEQACDSMITFVKQDVDLIVIDSFAALLPLAEEEEGMEQQFIGLQSRMLNKMFRKVVPINSNTVIIATNQLRQDIGGTWGRGVQQRIVGGLGQLYYASLILETRRKEWILEKKQRVGFTIECFVSKCNYAPPFQSCKIPFNFYKGQLDVLSSLIDLAIDVGIIKQSGPYYEYSGFNRKLRGREEISSWFNEEQDRIEKLKQEILI